MSATPPWPPVAVVKLGGSCLDLLDAFWWDDLARQAQSRPLILLHGWSRPLRRLHPRHRRQAAMLRDRYGNQSRWTTPEVIDDIKTVSAALSREVLRQLQLRDVTAEWLLGSDGLIGAGPGERLWWRGKRLVELENLVGPPTSVHTARLARTRPGHIPLVTPLARNTAGQEVNTDADRAAAAVAGAVGAADLVLVTDVTHLMADGKPVHSITEKTAVDLRDKVATGGMRKKLRAACEALEQSVERVVIGNAPVTALLTTHAGTVITRG